MANAGVVPVMAITSARKAAITTSMNLRFSPFIPFSSHPRPQAHSPIAVSGNDIIKNRDCLNIPSSYISAV